MKFAQQIAFILLMCFSTSTYSQDIHFTNYDFAPLNFNPGLTGSFLGSVRIGGIFRDQYRPFLGQPYTTTHFYADSPFMKGLKDHHWIGFGFVFYNDKAGLFGLKTAGMTGSAAYHWAFDKEYKNVLTLGVQYGGEGKKTNDQTQAVFQDNAFGGNSVDMTLFDAFETSASDANVGILLKSKVSKIANFEAGVAVYRLLNKRLNSQGGMTPNPNPNPNPTPQANDRLGRRINAHARYRTQTSSRFAVEPALFVSLSGAFYDISAQFRTEYRLQEDFTLKLGAGYRVGDALELLFGAKYKSWVFGLSYDVTLSTASTLTSFAGGFEIGAYKIFNIYKRPNPDKAFICPRL